MKNKRRPELINKPFNDLNREELYNLIRKHPRYTTEEMIELYKVDGETYIEKIKEIGLMPTRDERRICYKWDEIFQKKRIVSNGEIYEPIDLVAMRLLRGYNTLKFARLSSIHESDVNRYEKSKGYAPGWVGKKYVEVLGIRRNELERLRMLIKGEINDFEVDRSIPQSVKERVWERDQGRCTGCESDQKIHYHHIKYFSKGGLHQESNLKLLCAACHAEVHKEDQSYHLLKHLAEAQHE